MHKYYSNGKLLLTGEYVVLDGAFALAVPTKFGQSLNIEATNDSKIIWKSFDDKKNIWFEDSFLIDKIASAKVSDNAISNRLIEIINAAKSINPSFLNTVKGLNISTELTFPKNWGLGTSSTLINNIAQWANIDPYKLLKNTFGGSGYDIACAQNNTPITYQLQENKPIVSNTNFNPSFLDNLYFIYLNKKQNSRDGIAAYKANKNNTDSIISEINDITSAIINSDTLNYFNVLITQHETLISKITKQTTVKDTFFKDFNGAIKSLGAWGGDFILASSLDDPSSYFKEKGFNTILKYKDMVL